MKIHLLEGSAIEQHTEDGEIVMSFAANLVDEWVELDARQLYDLMVKCSLTLTASYDEIVKCMEAGSNTLVVDHTIPEQTRIHLIREVEPIGTMMQGPSTLQ